MKFRPLGRTGLKVSELCLGTMQFGWTADETESFSVLSAAIDAGINFIYTADIYSRWVSGNPGGVAEEILGKWMKKSGVPRSQIVLATKVRGPMGPGPNDEGLSRAHILQAVEGSLRRLQTDYIDLYQTHWPDETTPLEETLSALDQLVRQGKVRYLGCSNLKAWELVQALWISDRLNLQRYDCLQPHYNLVHRAEFEQELSTVCEKFGLGVIPYSPLAGGFLTGKYSPENPDTGSSRQRTASKYFNDRNWKLLEEMEKITHRYGLQSITPVALAWLLQKPVITSPIIGPRSVDQLNQNLAAVNVQLDAGEMTILNQASESTLIGRTAG